MEDAPAVPAKQLQRYSNKKEGDMGRIRLRAKDVKGASDLATQISACEYFEEFIRRLRGLVQLLINPSTRGKGALMMQQHEGTSYFRIN